jgi:hypothetical protein
MTVNLHLNCFSSSSALMMSISMVLSSCFACLRAMSLPAESSVEKRVLMTVTGRSRWAFSDQSLCAPMEGRGREGEREWESGRKRDW